MLTRLALAVLVHTTSSRLVVWNDTWAKQNLKCNTSAPEELLEWCKSHCSQIMQVLRMREDVSFDKGLGREAIDRAELVDIWSQCGLGYYSMYFLKAAEELRQLRPSLQVTPGQASLDKVQRMIVSAEVGLRQLLLGQVNLTLFFAGSVSAAPFFYMDMFLQELQLRFPKAIGYRGKEGKSAVFEEIVALREYLLQDAPTAGPLGMVSCDNSWNCSVLHRSSHPLQQKGAQSIEIAALLLAEADFMRHGRGNQLMGRDGQELQRLINLGHTFLMQAYRHELARSLGPICQKTCGLFALAARSDVPIFAVLDRLDSLIVAPLLLPRWTSGEFLMHLLPTRNVESSYVRAFVDFHCDLAFKDMLSNRRDLVKHLADFRVVEVGSNLGGCILYALTQLGDGTRGLAVEPYSPAAAALRRTIAANGIGKRLSVDDRFICANSQRRYVSRLSAAGAVQHQTQWYVAEAESLHHWASVQAKPCASLSDVLLENGIAEVDVLRVHVLGRELEVLQSAEQSLKAGKIKALAVAILREDGKPCHGQEPGQIARLLRSHGYYLEYCEGKWRDDEVVDVLSAAGFSALIPDGTTTLFAQLNPHKPVTCKRQSGAPCLYLGR